MIESSLGHYRLLDRLGEGGMGEVWKAYDPKLQRTVAIKVLKETEDAASRILAEARASSALDHPNICTVHEVGEADGQAFIVMAYVDGKPLSELIPADGLLPETVIRYGTQIAGALAHAHDKGIVHRDLKSANVVITPDGRAKVLDFGVADRLPEADAEALTQTFDSRPTSHLAPSLVGTLAYMAPEVLQGQPATARSDIWALGVLLFEMVSGRLPFGGTTQTAVIAAVVKDPPAGLPARVSAGLRTVAQRCLQKEPRQRYGQAAAVHAALEALQSGEATVPPTDSSRSPQAETFTASSSEPAKTSVPWIAVLPFKVRGGGEEIRELAEGLSEDVVTGLAQFPYLSVLGADTTLKRRSSEMDARTFGGEMGARYVVEGSIRASGSKLRVNVLVVDTATGTNIWAERLDRSLADADTFDVQDELTDRIVATIADTYGALVRDLGELALAKPSETLTADDAVFVYFSFNQRGGPVEHLRARAALERVVEKHPRHATAWACLSLANMEEYRHNLNPRPGSLDRALEYARRALEIDRTSQLGYHALASTQYFRRDLSAFREAAERAAALNPRDTFTVAHMGLLTAYGGDWSAGTRMAARAMALNPHHPGWYHFGEALNHYRLEEYDQALAAFQRINMPLLPEYHVWLAATNGQLGREGPASAAVRELLAIEPDFAETAYREQGKWYFCEESRALLERLFDGLRKAGLDIPGPTESPDGMEQGSRASSSEAKSPEHASIVVLPFTNTSPHPDQEYFSDGLTEEIISDLSGIRALTVISRTSAMQLKGTTKSIREIGDELNVSHVLEGSVRKAGSAVRVTARLVDAEKDTQVWSEKYSGSLDDVFDIQERLSRSIVDALEVTLNPEESHKIAEHPIADVNAYDCYQKARHEIWQATEASLRHALTLIHHALEIVGDNPVLYAALGQVYVQMVHMGLPDQGHLEKAADCVEKVFALEPDSPDGHALHAFLSYKTGHLRNAVRSSERALAMDSDHVDALGWRCVNLQLGRMTSAAAAVERLVRLDPLTYFTYFWVGFQEILAGRFERGVEAMGKMRQLGPDPWVSDYAYAVALALNGERERALPHLDAVSRKAPEAVAGFARFVRHCLEGDREAALGSVAPGWTAFVWEDEFNSWIVADCYAQIGELDEALRWLEHATLEREFINYPFFSELDPMLGPLRGDERFGRLMERVKAEWERPDPS